jgi:hypothetical protein
MFSGLLDLHKSRINLMESTPVTAAAADLAILLTGTS